MRAYAVSFSLALVSVPLQAQQKKSALEVGMEFVRIGREVQTTDHNPIDLDFEFPHLQQRKQLITKELAPLSDHEWAGVYHQGDGLGVNVFLCIAPNGGATYTSSGCTGLDDLNYGTIRTVTAEGIQLGLALSPSRNSIWYQAYVPHPYMSSLWVPASWGSERFLIPDCQLIPFCNAVNSGGKCAQFPRRIKAEQDVNGFVERPAGLPRIPRPYDEFLLQDPLTTVITSCSEPKAIGTFVGGSTTQYLVLASVAIGREAGLLPGMLLRALDPGEGTGEVVRVESDHASVEFRCGDDDVPKAGWRLSTRKP